MGKVCIKEKVRKRVEEEASKYPDTQQEKPERKISTEEVCACYWQDDDGNADLFERLFAGRLCYDHDEGTWNIFNGQHWERDKTKEIRNLTREVAEEFRKAALTFLDDDTKEGKEMLSKLRSRAKSLTQLKHKRSMLELAMCRDGIAVTGEEWDGVQLKVACQNGVINLETGELEPGNPEDMIRSASPVEWKGLEEPCPKWERFLSEILDGDEEMVGYLQRVFGYCLAGVGEYNHFYYFYGEHGRNGKSTMFEVLFKIFGNLAVPVRPEMFIERKMPKDPDTPSPSIMDLRNKRLAWAAETDDNKRFSASEVKRLSGGDTLTARLPYGKGNVSFQPTHTLFLLSNHELYVSSNEGGFWPRLRFIDFPWSFVENPDPKKPYERQADTTLKACLMNEELPGILAWLVRGCLQWLEDGHLDMPEKVRAAVDRYRDDMDTLGKFLREACEPDENAELTNTELYKAFKSWAIGTGVFKKTNIWSAVKFGREMTKHANRSDAIRKVGEEVKRPRYLGVRIRDEFGEDSHA